MGESARVSERRRKGTVQCIVWHIPRTILFVLRGIGFTFCRDVSAPRRGTAILKFYTICKYHNVNKCHYRSRTASLLLVSYIFKNRYKQYILAKTPRSIHTQFSPTLQMIHNARYKNLERHSIYNDS